MKEVNEQIENQVWWQVKTQLLNQVDRQVYWRVNGQLYLAGLNLHGIVSDGTIIVLSSHANGNIRLNFENLFPVSLSPLQFDVTESDVEYLECDVSFNYTLFTVDSDPL